MNPVQTLSLDHLLTSRGKNGTWLAEAIGADPSSVSRWRNGLKPGKTRREEIATVLDLNEHEIRALGWEDDNG
jgi:hypothetical protein